MESFYSCLKANFKHGHEKEFFWVSGVLLVTVGIFGVIGNTLNLVVLFHYQLRRKTFYKLLILLAMFDLLFLASYGISIGYQSLACQPTNNSVGYYTFYFLNFGLMGSVYSTVAVTIERYISIVHPRFMARPRIYIYSISVITISMSFCLPMFISREYSVVNGTLVMSHKEWAQTHTYEKYYDCFTWFIVSMFPCMNLIICNLSIIIKIYQRPNNSQNCYTLNTTQPSSRLNSTTKILFLVVFVFLLTHTIRLAYKFLYKFRCTNEDEDCMSKWYVITPIYKLLLMSNSAVNCIIYCLFGRKFRKVFNYVALKCFCWCNLASISNHETYTQHNNLN